MVDKQKPNKPLFSQHYLEHRIQECSEWEINVSAAFDKFNKLYLSKKDLLSTISEAQTEEVFIKPALDILGFSYIPQVTTRGKGRSQRPDYALFTNIGDRDAAYPLQNDEPAFYTRVKAIAEAKYWERPLNKVSANDKRDVYKNENPSFQISSYLTGTGVDWGILTNGREWRLYYRQASSTATEFYPIDLVELLETNDLEQFKYFWLFFRSEALVKDPHGRNFLERVREGSTTYATRVGNELKALVFDQVFPGLAGGFVADATRRGETVTAEQLYEATLAFLYKLLFLLYAEARNLLPIDQDYRDHSLIKITQEVAQGIVQKKKLSQTSTGLYDRLLSLFQIIDRGDSALEVPRYNGGLFHFDFNQISDQAEYRANHFLFRFKLSDAVLAPVLDRLARFEEQPIDYSFLGVRQLGSIYEGLLEYRVVIDTEETRTRGLSPLSEAVVHLENDKGERKATGSYYTPDYIVKYIVSHTLKPILEERKARFDGLMTQIVELHERMQDQRLGVQSIRGLQKDLQGLQREAQSTLLDIKVCDPAMGSGHFLVEVVDYLTDELIGILTEYPEYNPVLEMLEQTRQSILENLEQQGITINPDRLEPTQLLQRVVMKRCIYGVDLNPMAVELAKVSLWLHSFTIGAPLSFLDHHLRCGNSLIGTTAKEAEAKMSQEESGQLNLLTGPFVGLLRAAEIMRGVSVLSDATFAEVEQSERLFRDFDEAAKPYKRLLDVYVAQFFGVKQAKNLLQRLGTDAITAERKMMSQVDAAVYDEAEKLSGEKRFFHWDLEFPEVFIDLDNASWKENSGFDVVVGNPPYVRQEGLGEIKPFLKSQYQSYHGVADLYIYFIERGLISLKNSGQFGFIISNKFMRANYGKSLRQLLVEKSRLKEIVDFGELPVFSEAATFPAIVIFEKDKGEQEQKLQVSKIKSLAFQDLENEVKLTAILVTETSLSVEGWSLADTSLSNILIKLSQLSLTLGEYVNNKIYWGIKTGFNEAFIIDKSIYNYLVEQDPKNAEIIKPLVVGNDVRKYEINFQDSYLIVIPNGWTKKKYLETNKEEVDFNEEIAWNYFLSQYQELAQHLLPFYENAKTRWDKGEFWWELRPCDYYKEFEKPKIIYPEIAREPRFTFDNNKYYANNKCFIIPNNDLYLVSLLNSSLLFNVTKLMVSVLGDEDAGGRLELRSIHLQNLPIRKINFTTPTNNRQQSLENAIALYNQYQTNSNPDPILNQVNHHLSQQPEEADVIHDLLAYLAEQMIELNKQKQAEIKSFLQWLERFIGCPIDTLTNKSKIQNYLGDYYKDQPHLSFDELIEVLKKNKKKIKIDGTARKEQQTLEKEYQATLDTLLPLKMQLMRCDNLIDQIVYKLYGLTDEEIAIVEGKSHQ